jgi:hypothetical protein
MVSGSVAFRVALSPSAEQLLSQPCGNVLPRTVAEETSDQPTAAKPLLVQVLSDVLNELQGLAAVHDGKHKVAFAAREALRATLGGGFYCCICAVKLGRKQKCDRRINQGHKRLV